MRKIIGGLPDPGVGRFWECGVVDGPGGQVSIRVVLRERSGLWRWRARQVGSVTVPVSSDGEGSLLSAATGVLFSVDGGVR